jgi:branched-chain amino acid transport system substrate-binding protein
MTPDCGKPAGRTSDQDRTMIRHHAIATLFGAAVTLAATAPATIAQTPIKIGSMHSLSGPLAIAGEPAHNGFALYFAQIGNKVAGRPIVIIKEDDAGSPSQGLERVRRLVERERLNMLVGISSSAVAYAVRNYIDQRQVPLIIMGSSGANDLTDRQGSPYIFRTSFSNRQLGGPFGPYACNRLGYKKIAVMASDFVTGHEQSSAFESQFTRAGCEVVKKVMVPLGTTDFAPFLSQLASTDADAVWAMFFGADAIAFVKQYDALGFKAKLPLIGPAGLNDSSVLNPMGKSGLGIASPIFYLAALDNPENKAFVDAYRQAYGSAPGSTAVSGYIAAQAITAALEAIKGDVENKRAFLEALKSVKLQTPMGPFEFDDKQNVVFDLYLGKVVQKGSGYDLEIADKMMRRVDQFGMSN